ncbi:MAG TPA: DUF1761 domain-containing protein [Candidatus Saccharimonadales bacterium]|nr:DUF1761 domain-containing protein [Candidatus Saccharimonadales bacterium]
MEIHINWLAVLLALVASMILAKTWFREKTFGHAWRELTGITPADSKKAGKKPIIITLFANIITVVALAAMIDISAVFFQNYAVWLALLTGFVAWLAFSATTLATHNAFEQKRQKLTLINNGYQLVLFLVIALIIGGFGS